MAYSKHVWETGEFITKDKMNNIENWLQSIEDELSAARGQDEADDNTLASRINDMIIVSDEQPSSANNEIWIRTSTQNDNTSIEIPTEAEFEALRDNIAVQYSEGATYEIGQYILYNNDLYKCVAPVTTGTWRNNANKFIKVTLTNEIVNVNEELNNTAENLKDIIADNELAVPIENWIEGSRWGRGNDSYATVTEGPVTNSTTASWRYAQISCEEGDIFTINGVGDSVTRVWAFIDNNKNVLARTSIVNNTVICNNEIIEAPENTAYLILNQNGNKQSCFKGRNTSAIAQAEAKKAVNTTIKLALDDVEDMSNTSFDNYTNPGTYRIKSSPSANNVTKPPINLFGKLIVSKVAAPDYPERYIHQLYLSDNNHIYTRYKRLEADTWTTWEEIAYKSNIDNLEERLIDLINNISSGASLDSPQLTGIPTAPTAVVGTNSTQIATTAFVQTTANTAANEAINESFKLGVKEDISELKGTGELDPLDLNNIVAPGTYRIASKPTSKYIINYPNNRFGKLIVCKIASPINPEQYIYQLYLGSQNHIYMRYKHDDELWTEWEELLHRAEFESELAKKLDLFINDNYALPLQGNEEESLNTIVTAGTYLIKLKPTEKNISDYPNDCNEPGKLIVIKISQKEYVYQIYMSSSGKTYIRSTKTQGTTWTAWKKLAFFDEIEQGIEEQVKKDIRESLPKYYTNLLIQATQKEFSETKKYKTGDRVIYGGDKTGNVFNTWGDQYVFVSDHYGPWVEEDVKNESFKSTVNYKKGDMVVYGNDDISGFPRLPYVFTEDHTGEWDSTKVTMIDSLDDNQPHIDKCIDSVPSGDHFFFITDTHWESNAKVSPLLLNYMKKQLNINTCIFGGDFIDGEMNKYSANQIMHNFANSMFSVFGEHFYTAIGNHDQNIVNYASRYIDGKNLSTETINAMMADRFLPYTAVYDCLFKPYSNMAHTFWDGDYWTFNTTSQTTTWTKNQGSNGNRILQIANEALLNNELNVYANDTSLNDELEAYGKMTYYIDDESSKTRIIVLMCLQKPDYGAWYEVFESEHIRLYVGWLYHTLLETPEGYNVVIVTHQLGEVYREGVYNAFTAEDGVAPVTSTPIVAISQMLMGLKLRLDSKRIYLGLKTNDTKNEEQTETIDSRPTKPNETYFLTGKSRGYFDVRENQVYNPWRSVYLNFSNANEVGRVFILAGHAHIDDVVVLNQANNQYYNIISSVYDKSTILDQTIDSTEDSETNFGGCPIPLIHVTTDAYERYKDATSLASTPEKYTKMQKDSVIEQAFDIVTMSKNGIDLTRVGAGNNRTIYMKYEESE